MAFNGLQVEWGVVSVDNRTAWRVFALLLISISTLPAEFVSAQPASEQTVYSVEDPQGDAGGDSGAFGFIDITAAQARLARDELRFNIDTAESQTHPMLLTGGGMEAWLRFEYRSQRFDAVVSLAPPPTGTPVDDYSLLRGRLYHMTEGYPDVLGEFPVTVNATNGGYDGNFSWDLLIQITQYVPQPGEGVLLLGFHTYYSAWPATPHQGPIGLGTGPVHVEMVQDTAAFPDGTFGIVPGAQGSLSVTTKVPIRYSNGEANTFHWPIEITNHGATELELELTFEGAESTDVKFPERLRLDAGTNRTVSVYVTVPFAHDHGSIQDYLLRVRSPQGDEATLPLGINYPQVPQPAGHHPDLYIHFREEDVLAGSILGNSTIWMNTVPDDALAAGDRATPRSTIECPERDPVTGTYRFGAGWDIRLQPALRIGLDGRNDTASTVELELVGQPTLLAGKLHGRWLLIEEGVLFRDNPFANESDPWRGVGNVPAAPLANVRMDVPMPPELDWVPPNLDKNLVLSVLYCPEVHHSVSWPVALATMADPMVGITKGTVRLAVNEYHDVIPILGNASVSLSVPDPVVRAPSGSTVVWAVDATFLEEGTYTVELLGPAAKHARLHGPARIDANGGRGTIPISLHVPEAPAGDIVNLVVDVTNVLDPADAAALRLAVLVDPAAMVDHSGELAALEGSARESPAGTQALVALALSVILVVCRRRR